MRYVRADHGGMHGALIHHAGSSLYPRLEPYLFYGLYILISESSPLRGRLLYSRRFRAILTGTNRNRANRNAAAS